MARRDRRDMGDIPLCAIETAARLGLYSLFFHVQPAKGGRHTCRLRAGAYMLRPVSRGFPFVLYCFAVGVRLGRRERRICGLEWQFCDMLACCFGEMDGAMGVWYVRRKALGCHAADGPERRAQVVYGAIIAFS